MTQANAYSLYLTVATQDHPVGYVVDRVVWDGASGWSPPSGLAAVADPDGAYPIGSTYAPPATAKNTAG